MRKEIKTLIMLKPFMSMIFFIEERDKLTWKRGENLGLLKIILVF